MKGLQLAGLSIQSYELPVGGAAMRTAHAASREGLEVHVELEDGRSAVGDAAPLPGHSMETLAETGHALERAAGALCGARIASLEEIESIVEVLDLPSAACHGIEQALLFALADAQNTTPAQLLGAAAQAELVCTNALVQTEEDAARAVAAGYAHLKLKVGREPLSADLGRIARVRAAVGSKVELRLDANGRWSDEVAATALAEFESLDIAYIEQPVAGLEALSALRRGQGIPLAADELCRSPAMARRIIEAEAADVLVVKPMLCGGLLAARKIAGLALAAGLGVVITSSLESAIGCEAALQLAAALPAPRRAAGLASSDPRWSQQPRMSVANIKGKAPKA